MAKLKTLFLSYFFSLVFCYAYSELHEDEVLIRKISFSDGLRTQTIFDLFVDKNGMLFLATDKGLLSYNGVSFKKYPFKDNLALSINSIQYDQNGVLWCKNFSNQVFYFENDTLKPYLPVEQMLDNKDENLLDFTFFNNKLHVLTENNFYYQEKDSLFLQVDPLCPNDNYEFFSLYKNKEKNLLYVASNNYILTYGEDKWVSKTSVYDGLKKLLYLEDDLYYILQGKKNKFYAGENEIVLGTTSAINPSLLNLSKTSQFLWVCTSNGLYKVDALQKEFTNHFLPNTRITDVVQDLEGNYWISSLDKGLFLIPNMETRKLAIPDVSNYQLNATTILANPDGGLFVGTSDGKIIQYNAQNKPDFVYHSSSNIPIEHIYSFEDKLIASSGIFQLGNPAPIIDAYFGKAIAEDDFGNFAMATFNSASLFSNRLKGKPNLPMDLENKIFYSFSDYFEVYTFMQKRSRSIHFSSVNGCYYIGYSDALIRYDMDGTQTEIKTPDNKPIIAVDLHEMKNGNLWIASSQQGLLHLNGFTIERQLTKKDGLSSNTCKKIQADAEGIWVITDENLDYFDFATNRMISEGNKLGLNDINLNDFFVNESHVWLATNEGVIYFPRSILNQQLKPFFEVLAFQADGQSIIPNASIPYSKNSVLFQMNSILYKSMGSYDYEYKLEPFHTDWQSQNAKQTELNFGALKPENYVLKARLKTGSFLSNEINFPFSVRKLFWQSTWFFLLNLAAVSLLFLLVYNWAVSKTKKKQHIKEMLAISQLTALKSQMNPHFMFNVLNAIQGLIYSNQKNKASDYISTFSTLMRKTLDFSSKSEVPIADEIETIKLYVSLEMARFDEDDFFYKIELPDEDLSVYSIPSLIIQPFVENAIKHGLLHKQGQKKLLFKLKRKDNFYWQFIIQDNGVGRNASQHINQKINRKHISFATNAIETRIQLINKLSDYPIQIEIEDLYDQLHNSKGTMVILYIPINRIIE